MGFFISDLHRQIEQLHEKQVSDYGGKPFIVYRGQGLSTTDFEKLRKTKGGLMSFNNFLSTSKIQKVSRWFAECASRKEDTIGVLFVMTIDPLVSSAPFAAIRDVSYFNTEEEVLFSMHTVFRIGEINHMDKNNSLYQVELKLTADDDEQLRTLTRRIRQEAAGPTGWRRIGPLLLKIGQFNKAEELYKVLLEQASDESEKAYYYNQLGFVRDHQTDYEKAIWYYEQALEIFKKTVPPNYRDLATSYGNIGTVYNFMRQYSKALSFLEKDITIREKFLPPNDPSLATSYNNIGSVYDSMGENLKGLSFHEKALEIYQTTLPPNHPNLAASYSNIGMVYNNIGDHSKALTFSEKALEIKQKTLPANHRNLGTSYNNIAYVYQNMKNYSKALVYFERALAIWQSSLPANHPNIQNVRENIEIVKKNM